MWFFYGRGALGGRRPAQFDRCPLQTHSLNLTIKFSRTMFVCTGKSLNCAALWPSRIVPGSQYCPEDSYWVKECTAIQNWRHAFIRHTMAQVSRVTKKKLIMQHQWMWRDQSLVSSTPSRILQLHAVLQQGVCLQAGARLQQGAWPQSGAGTQRRKSPVSCTSLSWGTRDPSSLCRLNTPSDICRRQEQTSVNTHIQTQYTGSHSFNVHPLSLPDHWFPQRCAPLSPGAFRGYGCSSH